MVLERDFSFLFDREDLEDRDVLGRGSVRLFVREDLGDLSFLFDRKDLEEVEGRDFIFSDLIFTASLDS